MERLEYDNLADRFCRLFTSVYEWKGLPKEIDPFLIERYCFIDGMALIWRSKEFGYVVTRGRATRWDINHKPKSFAPLFDFKPDGATLPEELTAEECVPIYDCSDWNIKRSDVLYKIADIVDVTESIRCQIGNQRTPVMCISGNSAAKEKDRVSLIDIVEGSKALFVDSDLTESIKVFDLKAPFNVEKLNAWKNVLINDILEQGGIDSQDAFMKKERKLVDEIEGNDEILNYFLADGLKARMRACDRMKELFGWDASVDVQGIVRPMMAADGSVTGGDDDGNREDASGGTDPRRRSRLSHDALSGRPCWLSDRRSHDRRRGLSEGRGRLREACDARRSFLQAS